ncbi:MULTISPECIES: glutathione S-transferase [Lentibacter]|jgi:glutathione S-transferase|uniref:Glutathione S-transferase n=1 Tax=Lentibacter algarum TaxID=576131 RepID=A0A1H3MBN3_9RHOB|nr:glutathione S-transferase [Lentibacter algarum]MCO4776023.1 glutathione S-transferase [Lentibacter algarum]WIF33033.1 glutathione S-transferase-like protein [Lentibacter algarum]SDY74117.1 Glutathione S-transferase [Lentibacter algarum]
MQLISSQASPFVRKVHVVLHETGQSQDIEVIEAGTTPINTPDHVRAANPTGKIPALIRPDGPALHDSRVITRFLDARAKSGLYPEARIWELLTLESMADAIMDAAVLITYEGRVRPEEQQSDVWKEAQWGKIRAALDVINTRWMSHLAGPLDASHIAVGCALGYLDFRHDARGWRTGVDALAKWNEAFQERESMQATAPA